MYHTTTGEAHELWMQSLECLRKIFTKSMSFVGVLGHERYHINIHRSLCKCQYLKGCMVGILTWYQLCLVFLPVGSIHFNGCICKQFRIFAPSLRYNQGNAYLFGISLNVTKES